jgi:hypothetical protein
MRLTRAVRVNPEMPVFFSVRRPETLFVSGFNSRLRAGRPEYDFPWSPEERAAFSVFDSPNELAEALSADDGRLRASAKSSMEAIRHVRSGLVGCLDGVDALERHRAQIAFIFLQEQLEQDLSSFMERIGAPLELAQVSPKERIHASMPGDRTELSETGMANIRKWFGPDLEVYDWCRKRRDEILGAG